MFSERLPHSDINRLTRALVALRAAAIPIIDLTESNPTAVGIAYPGDLFDELSADHVRRYDPQPLGLGAAREAIAADYARRGARVDPTQVVLSASSSEAYSWLFKLLCNPGDGVLVPQPSYPLFEHLTRLESVDAIPYQLRYHGRWDIDFDSVIEAPAHVRALLLVSPNNPTGSYVTRDEAERLAEICRSRGWAIVADEVFADYPLEVGAAPTESVMDLDVLSFTLGGASKSLGLPQIKLGWIVVRGRQADVAPSPRSRSSLIHSCRLERQSRAQRRPCWPGERRSGTRFVNASLSNLACARDLARQWPACTLLPVEGGWSLVARVPAVRSEEALAVELLERERVLVHPGYFFDFPHEAFIVVSLIPTAGSVRGCVCPRAAIGFIGDFVVERAQAIIGSFPGILPFMTLGSTDRRAGMLVPLFSMPSARSWGIGEIGDLERMTRMACWRRAASAPASAHHGDIARRPVSVWGTQRDGDRPAVHLAGGHGGLRGDRGRGTSGGSSSDGARSGALGCGDRLPCGPRAEAHITPPRLRPLLEDGVGGRFRARDGAPRVCGRTRLVAR